MLPFYLVRAENRPAARCHRWRVVVRFPADASGKRRTRSCTVEGSRRVAKAKGAEFSAEVEHETPQLRDKKSVTMREAWDEWNARLVEIGRITAKSAETKDATVKKTMNIIGDVPVRLITASMLEETYARIGKNVCGATLAHIQRYIAACIEDARRHGLVDVNVAEDVTVARRDTAERPWLSIEEVENLIRSLPDNENGFAVALIARTGMRSGEACAVLAADYTGNGIHIRRDMTKTNAGARYIPLDEDTRAMVDRRLAQAESTMKAVGMDAPDDMHLVCRDDGRPVTATSLRSWWKRRRADYGCEGLHLHDLRHSYVTALAKAGVDVKAAQRLAGHKDAGVTMGVYTHADERDKLRAVEMLAEKRADLLKTC